MNDLYKTKKVLLGLKKHPSYSCKSCPYNDVEDCTSHLMEDAFDVIAAQEEMMNRKEMAKDKSGFIMLTQWGSTKALQKRVVIKIDDILYVSDLSNDEDCGSNIRLKGVDGFTIVVAESIEEILSKISESKGEKKDECAEQG